MAAARPARPQTRKALVARLWRAAARQVALIEARLGAAEAGIAGASGTSHADAPDPEKDAKLLASLARTLRELVLLDEAVAPRPAARPREDDDDEPPRDPDDFRRELARRLERLRGAGED